MDGRRLIYLHHNIDAPLLLQSLSDAGWSIDAARDIKLARTLLQQEAICLGIVHFGDHLTDTFKNELEQLMRVAPDTEWIGITSPAHLDELLQNKLIPGYFFDYHTEPVDWPRLAHSLGHAYGMAHANMQARGLLSEHQGNSDIIGVSDKLQEVLLNIRKIAGVDAPVMISGESGTGKELAARAIHDQSGRRNGPFIAINCGAISPTLIHSELFGHERGSFTGAHRRKIGRLEAADGGTIFLDEIGDLPLDLQVNLLRFLQEHTIERVGGMESIRLNVRVITASHIDIQEAVARGRFREDLYYRLNVVQLRMPALRERVEDIEPLAQYFFSIFAKERNHNVSGFSQQALQAMNNYDWPGNVRELINKVRRATIMCEHRLITPAELELGHVSEEIQGETLAEARIEAEIHAIQTSLRLSNNNVSEAARRLGVARMTLYRLLQKHRLTATYCNLDNPESDIRYRDSQPGSFPLSIKTGGSQ